MGKSKYRKIIVVCRSRRSLAPSISTAGRKAWYEWITGRWNGTQTMSVEENGRANDQELPHWHTSHVPKEAPTSKGMQENLHTEQADIKEDKKADVENSEGLIVNLKEILRYQKRLYDIRSVWQGFVKMEDVLETQPMKELKAHRKDFEYAIGKDQKTCEEETWKGEKYIRLMWNGGKEEPQKDTKEKETGVRIGRKEKMEAKANQRGHHTNKRKR